ncbi:hypothetical protein [Streptomyces sp. fd1-xmd]|uniref:hypothetical protein n=1 Tax=Streptomyces sp. fd1-xmd TaxID=1812480 RepID=UPI0009907892|nr:hypothetical protein [Streptomyces sp. fd1-xmd]AQT72196.1 hypothetical protein B1K54_11350 [Streptomyces sp. fd1-xmd]
MFESFAPPLRATRAAMFAAVCVALGAVGHARMSGMDVPPSGLLGAFAVTAVLAWFLAGRRRGPVGIAAAVLSVQGVLHFVFSGSRAAESAAGPAAVQGHHHMPATGAAGMADTAGMAEMAGAAAHGGAGMIAAHVLAGLVCAAWLARGEAAVFRLARVLGAAALHAARPLARALVLVRARVAAVAAPPVFRAPHRRPRRLRGAVHAHAVVRRGPPWSGSVHRSTAPGRPARA